MYHRYQIIFVLLFVLIIGSHAWAENLAEESFRAYQNGVYPYDPELGEINLFVEREKDGILVDVVRDLRRGRLEVQYLNLETRLLTLTSYQNVMSPVITVRVGSWLNQGNFVSVRLKLLAQDRSQIVELLFDQNKSMLMALYAEEVVERVSH